MFSCLTVPRVLQQCLDKAFGSAPTDAVQSEQLPDVRVANPNVVTQPQNQPPLSITDKAPTEDSGLSIRSALADVPPAKGVTDDNSISLPASDVTAGQTLPVETTQSSTELETQSAANLQVDDLGQGDGVDGVKKDDESDISFHERGPPTKLQGGGKNPNRPQPPK